VWPGRLGVGLSGRPDPADDFRYHQLEIQQGCACFICYLVGDQQLSTDVILQMFCLLANFANVSDWRDPHYSPKNADIMAVDAQDGTRFTAPSEDKDGRRAADGHVDG
jgi:hypothetical protein